MSDAGAGDCRGGAEQFLLRAADAIDNVSRHVGHVVAFLTFATVLLCFATVYLRYALNLGVIWLQELYVWTHVFAIMLGAGYVLLRGGFVRVDLLYAHMGARARALVDLLGTLFLMWPFLIMMALSGWQFFLMSYRMNEASQQETGLTHVWILKATLMAFVVSVGFQGFGVIARSLATLVQRRQPASSSPSLASHS